MNIDSEKTENEDNKEINALDEEKNEKTLENVDNSIETETQPVKNEENEDESKANLSEENNQVEPNNENNIENSDAEAKNNVPMIIAVIIVVLIAICIIVYGIVSFFEKENSNKGKKFMQLATTDQKVLELIDTEKLGNGQTNVKAKVDIDDIVAKMGGEEIEVGNLSLDSIQIIDNQNYSSSSLISLGNVNAEIQLAKTGDLLGINIPEITNKFIGIDTSDLYGLVNNLRKLGILVVNEDAEKSAYTEEQNEELIGILKKYFEVIVNNMGNFIVENSNVTISAHNKTDKAKEYIFTLNGESFTKIGVAVEKELIKNREDIEKLVNLGLFENVDDTINTIESDIKYNEEIIKNGAYDDIFDQVVAIKLYEKQGKNIATIVDASDYEFAIYYFEDSNDNYEVVFKFATDENDITAYWTNENAEGNIKNGTLGMVYNGEDITLTNVTFEKSEEAETELISISGDNILLLNSATQEDLDEFSKQVSNNVQKYIMKILFSEQK